MNVYFIPRVHPDGNCLYGSLSVALVGDGTLSLDLRILVAIELYRNAVFYAEHLLVKEIYSKNLEAFQSENSVFCMMLSHFASQKFVIGSNFTKPQCIIEEACSTLVVSRFSSIICICALASVLGKSISSFSPTPITSKLYSLRNFSVHPRIQKDVVKCPLIIFWSRCSENTSENHFVPLVAESVNTTTSKPRVLSQGSLKSFLPIAPKRKSTNSNSTRGVGKFYQNEHLTCTLPSLIVKGVN